MSESLIIAITGPAGSGKSTVATKLAKEIENSVNIDVDLVKHFIVNGHIYGETEAGIPQWSLLGENIGLLAKNFSAAGYQVIINGYINEPAWETLTKHVTLTYKLLLLPVLETCQSRDKERKADFVLGDKAIAEHHEYFSTARYFADFIRVDSTSDSAEETVQKIKAVLGWSNWGES